MYFKNSIATLDKQGKFAIIKVDKANRISGQPLIELNLKNKPSTLGSGGLFLFYCDDSIENKS